jgi:hypothetical protein
VVAGLIFLCVVSKQRMVVWAIQRYGSELTFGTSCSPVFSKDAFAEHQVGYARLAAFEYCLRLAVSRESARGRGLRGVVLRWVSICVSTIDFFY